MTGGANVTVLSGINKCSLVSQVTSVFMNNLLCSRSGNDENNEQALSRKRVVGALALYCPRVTDVCPGKQAGGRAAALPARPTLRQPGLYTSPYPTLLCSLGVDISSHWPRVTVAPVKIRAT